MARSTQILKNWLNGKSASSARRIYCEIADSYGLKMKQVKQLMERQRRKEWKIAAGYIPRPKGRSRKEPESEEVKRNNEIAQLRMQVELLQNYLFEELKEGETEISGE